MSSFPVRVVLVTPAVGEPLAEPGALQLSTELGPEAPASVAESRSSPLAQGRAGPHACRPGASGRTRANSQTIRITPRLVGERYLEYPRHHQAEEPNRRLGLTHHLGLSDDPSFHPHAQRCSVPATRRSRHNASWLSLEILGPTRSDHVHISPKRDSRPPDTLRLRPISRIGRSPPGQASRLGIIVQSQAPIPCNRNML